MALPDPSVIGRILDAIKKRKETQAKLEGWQYAPGTSHLARWKVEADMLILVFKQGKDGGESQPFGYRFETEELAQQWSMKIAASGHPYGQVVYPGIIKAGVAFTRL